MSIYTNTMSKQNCSLKQTGTNKFTYPGAKFDWYEVLWYKKLLGVSFSM